VRRSAQELVLLLEEVFELVVLYCILEQFIALMKGGLVTVSYPVGEGREEGISYPRREGGYPQGGRYLNPFIL